MRWSNLFAPTLRDAPADAEAISHKLLIRGGFIRQLHAGHYSMLPLGFRVHQKVAGIVREEMDAIGGQELLLPAMQPASSWKTSGRWDRVGEELFRITDRRGNDVVLGLSAEEVFTGIALELTSYRELPQIWYQIQTKFRDEPRPKSGLLRVREFDMKDSYSFDIDEAGLDRSFDLHHHAYTRIFERFGVDAFPVDASSGSMGGDESVEFMVPSPAGEDDVVRCRNCDYAANVEKATSRLDPIDDGEPSAEPESFPTPGVRTIAALEEFEAGAPADRQIKTMAYVVDGSLTLALVRGDHALNEQKLSDATGGIDIRPAEATETVSALGANPGSLGAVGVGDHTILGDHALQGRTNMTTGANRDDWHLRGVDLERDIKVDRWVDLRQVGAGEACPNCEGVLEVVRCIEAGHIFKLGRLYAEAFGATVLDADGEDRMIIMGSYGIGIGRAMAYIAETHHDENGLRWPVAVAPFEAVITMIGVDDETTLNAAGAIYEELRSAGVDVLLDDRDARPGVKFADAELVGIPYRITVGPRGLADGQVEVTERATGETENVAVDYAAEAVAERVRSAVA